MPTRTAKHLPEQRGNQRERTGDIAKRQECRRDRPEGPLVVSTLCSENKRAEFPKLSERAALAGLAMLALVGAAAAKEPPALNWDNYTQVYTDQTTGCQYLVNLFRGGMTPRIAADGKTHMGCKEAKGEAR